MPVSHSCSYRVSYPLQEQFRTFVGEERVKVFHESPDYIRTEVLLSSRKRSFLFYLVVDYWTSERAFDCWKEAHNESYTQLEKTLEQLTFEAKSLGWHGYGDIREKKNRRK